MIKNIEIFEHTPIPKAVFKFALPTVLSMIVAVLYNMVDAFFVGQTGDPSKFAAVNVATPVFLFLMAAGNIFGMGGSSFISRALGEKNYDKVKNIASFCLYAGIFTGIAGGALILINIDWILSAIGTTETTAPFAREYLNVIAWAGPIIVLSNAYTNLLRGEGAAKNSMNGMMAGTIVNIILDPIFILDSFLGSGTTAAVAQKMSRRYIGIEMGDHAYTHCKPRLDSVIAGTDSLGITKAVNWQGGGGYRFYELAPSLINKDPFDEYVINPDYDADMLAAAMALHEGFTYQPDSSLFWKQSVGNENSYLFVTTRHLNSPFLDSIRDTMEDGEYLIIACRSFDAGLEKAYGNITIKKIPQMLLDRCEFGKTDYNLNIVHPPVYDDEEEECDE